MIEKIIKFLEFLFNPVKINNKNQMKNKRIIHVIKRPEEINDFNKLSIKPLFSYNELILYNELQEYIKNKNLILLSKVRLTDLIKVSQYDIMFNKLSKKHIDFLITDTKGNIKVLIELDWESHESPLMKKNDKLKNELFDFLKIPLIRFKNNTIHDLNEISRKLA